MLICAIEILNIIIIIIIIIIKSRTVSGETDPALQG